MGTGTARLRGASGGLGRLASAITQGGEQQGYDESMANQTRMAQALAAIDRDRAAAEQQTLQTDMLRGRPQVMRDLIAANAGTDGRTLDAFEQKLRTGEMVTNFEPELSSRITQALTRFAPLAGNTGDLNPQQWAQALGAFGDQDLQRNVVSGDMPPDQRSRGMAVLKASPIVKIPEGFTGDQYSGAIPIDSPVNQGRAALVSAQTGAQRALANNRNAPPAPPAPRPGATTTPPPGGAPAPDDRASLALELGAPVADRDPFANMSGTQADIFKRGLYQQADKKLNEMDDAASTARNMARDMQRFLQLQKEVSMQGPIAGRVMALSSEAQEMDAITDKITPQMRQPGSGATSDFDAKMFRNSTVGRTKNEAANEAIGQAVILQTQNTSDRAQFMRDYLTVNGHLDGADRQWARYLNANPIFDPKSPQVPRLNAARVPYQQFFGGQGSAPAAAGAGFSDAEKERRYQEWKAKQP